MGRGHTSEPLGCDAEICEARGRVAGSASTLKTRIGMKQSGVGRWFALVSLRIYQIFFGPFFGGACKFYPSCSAYAYEAIERFGARQGARLAMGRLMRCRPFTSGGFDPVPQELPSRRREDRNLRDVTSQQDGRAVEVLR